MYCDNFVTTKREMAGQTCLQPPRRLAVTDFWNVSELCAVSVGDRSSVTAMHAHLLTAFLPSPVALDDCLADISGRRVRRVFYLC